MTGDDAVDPVRDDGRSPALRNPDQPRRRENGAPMEVQTEVPINGSAPHEPNDNVVRCLRRQLRMTQEELAQALGITVGTVSRWEKGRFRPSRLARALLIEFARAHNVDVDFKPVR